MNAMRLLIYIFLLGTIIGCTEPYALQSTRFESALVIQATITNEMKQHVVKLSRTYRLEETGPSFESGADVYLEDDSGNVMPFEEQDAEYISENAFIPDAQHKYTLHIVTSDGNSYSSTAEKLTTATPIENLTPVAIGIGNEQGVEIRVNTYDPTGTSRYYRYEYEEAGRFKVPFYSESEVVLFPDNNDDDSYPEILLLPRTEDARTCYRKGKSNKILVTSTQQLSEDRVINFPIRAIVDTSYILNDRYGIKVRQYVQNLASYTFYKTLREFSSTGNILSQNQPGFFYGNMRNDQHPNEKVIGYFEVSSVSEKVLMFNFNDIFPSTIAPPWPYECTFFTYNQNVFAPGPLLALDLINDLSAGTITYYEQDNQGFYIMVSDQCGDCRVTGSNVQPAFWQD
ncbi:DUF4249 domain-containing protein [Flavobacterium sp. MAH-1]|uniref:DUF4249 domain-containing protein n=1 Tax=Flavobacterium agri TaxID=2743471 RepID=A0A7Y8Y4K5_9FLAO|nr:DUF4249 domain-containing protein [Flavobacterium agri]NUY81749.1 DUF4249 domain-containing protein [Flavobacterium agri]NYA71773.1 DUF4249 domain-containing protein [Flavobacterium agri]